MADGHDHVSAAVAQHAGAAYKRRLVVAFCLIGGFFLVELVGGLLTNSLALLSDAGHMLTDVLGIGMAVAAIHLASTRRDDAQRSFGLYRLEILAALANAVLLTGLAGYVLYESIRRLVDPPEVLGLPMLVIGALGLVVNLVAFWLLRGGKDASLNIQGAYLEVLADLIASVGVVTAAVVVQTTGFTRIDPIFAIGIALFIVPRAWRLGSRAVRVLVQAAPHDIDLSELRGELHQVDGVADVHDLHLWTLTSGMEVASVHLRLDPGADAHDALDRTRALLRTHYGIEHATVQVEPAEHEGCDGCGVLDW
ncbi:MAG: cation diffusion facilitator family transporter [Nitriliruptoraceae bacterium]